MAYKTKKQRMPDGWVQVQWKDVDGHKWTSNMPQSYFKHFYLRLLTTGGVVTRTVD
jgi:hypothetical protein